MKNLAAILLLCAPLLLCAQPSPQVVDFSPDREIINADPNTLIELEFSLDIDPVSITEETFQIMGRWSGPSSGTREVIGGTTIRFTPDEPFFAGEMVTTLSAVEVKSEHQVRLWNCGSQPWIHLRQNRPAHCAADSLGLVGLGSLKAIGREQALQAGDLLFCYTDGVTEERNTDGRMFGEQRLEALVVEHARQSAADIKRAILSAVSAHLGQVPQSDDLTLVVVKASE